MSQDTGRAHPSDRATRPTDQAPAGLGDTASVPCAAVDLAEQCEASLVADRELDNSICVALGWKTWLRKDGGQPEANNAERGWFVMPRFTASLDAAMTLVPEGWAWSAGVDEKGCRAITGPMRQMQTFIGVAKSPALALSAAALRARAEQVSA